MDYQEAKSVLINLLCVSVDGLTINELSKLVRKRFLQWHPDKNKGSDKYSENFRELFEAWNRFKKGEKFQEAPPTPEPSTSFTAEDIYCDEKWDPSWDSSDVDSDYNSTPFDDDFFHASPKKKFAIPEDLRLFFRSKSNRRAGKYLFLLYRQAKINLYSENKVFNFYR